MDPGRRLSIGHAYPSAAFRSFDRAGGRPPVESGNSSIPGLPPPGYNAKKDLYAFSERLPAAHNS